MRSWSSILLLVLALVVAGCGDDDAQEGADTSGTPAATSGGTETPGGTETSGGTAVVDRAGVNVRGQETLLITSESFRSTLEGAGVELSALAPATLDGDTITIPITGGRVAIEDGGGTVDHDGGFVLAGGEGRVEVDDLFVDTRSGTVFGRIGGSQVRILRLDTSGLSAKRGEDSLVVGDLEATLAGDGAAVLKEELGAELPEGAEVGTVRVELAPRLPDAAGAPSASAEEGKDAVEAGRDAVSGEIERIEERVRALAEEAGTDLDTEAQQRLRDAQQALEDALTGR